MIDNRPPFVPGLETYFAAYPVVMYETAQELLEKLSGPAAPGLPKLIVMDLARSTDSSLSVLRVLKADERLRSIPVLMRRSARVSSAFRTITSSAHPEKTTSLSIDWSHPLQFAS
ncbi:hypothetical protein GCM10028803_30670 [Larkinella knui]